ncbi:hypothetical protein FRC01_009114 [Tulasnella sp. 417]|nr:hypothetical protein FRC01_009114 [Tulasnella sp. 417]
MKSDFGDYYASPDFDLSRTSALNPYSAALTLGSAIEASSTFSSFMPSSTVSLLPSSTSPQANPKDGGGTSHINPLVIGIPLTMLGMALLGAFIFCLTRSRREQREAGGSTAGLNPVCSAARTVFHPPPPAPGVVKRGSLETGEATFFNVSLNKTPSDLSLVEKSVCGAISAGSAAARPVHVRQQDGQQESEVSSKSQARGRRRLSLVDEDEHYTTPPPRTWQRRDPERYNRDRSWALEKQLRRALERESDLQWEIERRESAWRKVNSSFPSPSRRRYEDEYGRSYTMHSAPEYRRHSDFGPDRQSPPSRNRPSAFRRRSPDHSASQMSYIDPPKYRSLDPQYTVPMQVPIPRPPTAVSDPRLDRPLLPEDDDMHATLSVVSAYCEPSPMIPFNDSSRPTHQALPPSSAAMAELPTSLRAGGRRVQPVSPHYPPGLERTTR